MAYDRADWHYGGDFPTDLPPEAGGTHIGMFLAWAILRGLASDELKGEAADPLAELMARKMTGPQFFLQCCDEKLWESDLNDDGNRFAQAYYTDGTYFKDYENTLAKGLPSMYHVADNWENHDTLAKVLDSRYAGGAYIKKRWWKLW